MKNFKLKNWKNKKMAKWKNGKITNGKREIKKIRK